MWWKPKPPQKLPLFWAASWGLSGSNPKASWLAYSFSKVERCCTAIRWRHTFYLIHCEIIKHKRWSVSSSPKWTACLWILQLIFTAYCFESAISQAPYFWMVFTILLMILPILDIAQSQSRYYYSANKKSGNNKQIRYQPVCNQNSVTILAPAATRASKTQGTRK